MLSVCIADDHQQIRSILRDYCLAEGFRVYEAEDGLHALDILAQHDIDLVLLDVMMPRLDGFETCRRIRETSMVPVIMITARGEDYERIMGLDMGADDYIVKPFVPAEVIARMRAILRRIQPSSHTQMRRFHNLTIDADAYTAIINDQPLELTKKEFEILWAFVSQVGRVFERDTLLDTVWGHDYEGDIRTVDTHIKRLRAKLDQHDHPNWDIQTVWGMGYKIEEKNHAS